MKHTGFRKSVMAAGLVATLILAGTGCTKQISSTETSNQQSGVQETVDPMSFTAIDAKFRDYTFSINEYMREHQAEATQKKTQGATPNGVAANCTYTISPDGQFESLQMEKRLENGVQVDEYFNLGDSIFVARTTVYDDGNYDPVDKYYIIDGGLYKVDGAAETVTKIADIGTDAGNQAKADLDLYFSFDEIKAIYG